MDWTITDEDKKLSEIAGKALQEERQRVQTEEGVVVVISEKELNQIEGIQKSFIEHLLSIPKVDVEFPHRDTASLGNEESQANQADGDTLGDHILRFPKIEEADFSRDRTPDRAFEW